MFRKEARSFLCSKVENKNRKDELKGAKTIGVFMGGSLGDTLVLLPSLHLIRETWSRAKIILISPKPLVQSGIRPADVLEGSGLVDEFKEYSTRSDWGGIVKAISCFRLLRSLEIDVLVYLIRDWSSASRAARDQWFFRIAGLKHIIGTQFNYSPPPRESFAGWLPNVADLHLKQLAAGGLSVPEIGQGCFDLSFAPAEIDKAKNWLIRNEVPETCNLVAFGIGSKMPSKVWPLSNFKELGRHLITKFNIYPVVFGGPEDRAAGQELIKYLGVGKVVAGQMSIREGAAIMRAMDLYVGNDTGTMHLASAAGIPCVAIFSARDYKGLWEPYGQSHKILRQNVSCSGCFLTDCRVDGHPCIQGISCDQVFKECSSFLASKVSKD